MRDTRVDLLYLAWVWLCVGLLRLLRRFLVMAFGLVLLALRCFLLLSSTRLIVVLVPGCWAYSAFSVLTFPVISRTVAWQIRRPRCSRSGASAP